MLVENIRIRNYKTLSKEPGQDIPITSGLSIVGPNNSGKTNIVEAIRLFFTGMENVYLYNRETDLTFGKGGYQTSIVATFKIMPDEHEVIELLRNIYDLLKIPDAERTFDTVQIYLNFSSGSNPSYRVFPNRKSPNAGTENAQYSKRVRDLVAIAIESYSVYYLPSHKSIKEIYDDVLLPRVKKVVAKTIEDSAGNIQRSLDEVSRKINTNLSEVNLGEYTAQFGLPNGSIEDLLKGFTFLVRDSNLTSMFTKGMGIQSAVILNSLRWITEKDIEDGKKILWLIEEPETYLHPNLNKAVKETLSKISEKAIVIITTHSLSFVSQDPKKIIGTLLSNGLTEIKEYSSYYEATKEIRSNIGVKFSDFFNFGTYNVLVEGKTDREYLQEIVSLLKSTDKLESDLFKIIRSNEICFLDFGGVKFLSGFLRVTWEHIIKETSCVSLFDGDDAGKKEIRDLQGYFGKKNIRFEANKDFISVKKNMSIEGLFPEKWIMDLYGEKPNWFDYYSIDSTGALEQFGLKDDHKESFKNIMLTKCKESSSSEDWQTAWLNLLEVINRCISS